MEDNSIDETLTLSGMDTERYIAIRNGEEVFHSDAYFNARSDMHDTRDRRVAFEAGFNRGFDAATKREQPAIESLRAQVATLTAELARVKALVEGAPSAGFQYRLCGRQTWNAASQYTVSECEKYNERNPNLPQFEVREVIARPNLNLEQKP